MGHYDYVFIPMYIIPLHFNFITKHMLALSLYRPFMNSRPLHAHARRPYTVWSHFYHIWRKNGAAPKGAKRPRLHQQSCTTCTH